MDYIQLRKGGIGIQPCPASTEANLAKAVRDVGAEESRSATLVSLSRDSSAANYLKCDEVKPACLKCSKAGLECSYRDLLDLAFRNETSKAAQTAQTKWRQRAKLKANSDIESTSSSGSDSSNPPPSTIAMTLGPLVRADVHERALNRFFYDYCLYVNHLIAVSNG
jgi:hypothetical protein